MMDDAAQNGVRTLIGKLDAAVVLGGADAVTARIASDLASMIQARALRLPERFEVPRPDCYARRLLHRDPGGRYTVVVMTWGPDQGTPLHDHAGQWCVEAVIQGEIEVTQFELVEDRAPLFRFNQETRIRADVGSSGSLIPPNEYHILHNAFDDRSSITVHVYGGEMDRCAAFEPRDDGWYERREKTLTYHD